MRGCGFGTSLISSAPGPHSIKASTAFWLISNTGLIELLLLKRSQHRLWSSRILSVNIYFTCWYKVLTSNIQSVILLLFCKHHTVYAGSFCDIQPHLTNVRLNQWLNLTYSHTNCTTEILLYTPGYADRILNREDVTGITKLPTDDVIINNGNPLPSCASQVLGTTNISIDLRITKEVEEILNGVLAVKGSRSHHSCGCSCIPIPPVRYRVMPELSSTSGKVHFYNGYLLFYQYNTFYKL